MMIKIKNDKSRQHKKRLCSPNYTYAFCLFLVILSAMKINVLQPNVDLQDLLQDAKISFVIDSDARFGLNCSICIIHV